MVNSSEYTPATASLSFKDPYLIQPVPHYSAAIFHPEAACRSSQKSR